MPPSEKSPARGRGAGFTYEVELEEGLQQYDTALDEAVDELESKGISTVRHRPRYQAPESTAGETLYDGRLPSDYAGYNMGELAELLRVVTEWADYTGHLAKMAQNEKIKTQEQLALVKARIRKSKDGPKGDKDDDVLTDTRYVDTNSKLVRATAIFEMFDAADAAARRDAAAVSRCITALQAQLERGSRVGAVDAANEMRLRERGPRKSPSRRR